MNNKTSILCPYCAKDFLYIITDRDLQYYQCNGCDSTYPQHTKELKEEDDDRSK